MPHTAPADARSWYLRGRYAEELGDLEEARRALDWTVRLDRSSPWSWWARARFAVRQGDAEQARADALEAQVRGLPQAGDVLEVLGGSGRGE